MACTSCCRRRTRVTYDANAPYRPNVELSRNALRIDAPKRQERELAGRVSDGSSTSTSCESVGYLIENLCGPSLLPTTHLEGFK